MSASALYGPLVLLVGMLTFSPGSKGPGSRV